MTSNPSFSWNLLFYGITEIEAEEANTSGVYPGPGGCYVNFRILGLSHNDALAIILSPLRGEAFNIWLNACYLSGVARNAYFESIKLFLKSGKTRFTHDRYAISPRE